MPNIRLRLTRGWPFPGKDRVASLLFSENKENRVLFPNFQGILALPWGMMCCDTRSSIEWQLYVRGEYEPTIAMLVRNLLGPGDCYLDVGANIGVHVLTAAERVGAQGQVIAVEPNPDIFERLKSNLRLNRVSNV